MCETSECEYVCVKPVKPVSVSSVSVCVKPVSVSTCVCVKPVSVSTCV